MYDFLFGLGWQSWEISAWHEVQEERKKASRALLRHASCHLSLFQRLRCSLIFWWSWIVSMWVGYSWNHFLRRLLSSFASLKRKPVSPGLTSSSMLEHSLLIILQVKSISEMKLRERAKPEEISCQDWNSTGKHINHLHWEVQATSRCVKTHPKIYCRYLHA